MYEVRNITLDGHQCRYFHKENRSRPTIVVLPGNLQEIESIQIFNESLGMDFNYYAVEVPGAGLTKPLHPSFTMAYLGDLLSRFIRTVVKSPTALLAVSYATPIALECAKQNTWVEQLVLAGSMKDTPIEEWADVFSLLSHSIQDRNAFSIEFIEALTVDDQKIPRRHAVKKAAQIKARKYTEDQFWCFVYNSLRLLVYKPSELEKIQCPTLCFTGDRDPYVTSARCRQLADLIPKAQFTTIENTDHLFMIERPDATVSLIREFLMQHVERNAA